MQAGNGDSTNRWSTHRRSRAPRHVNVIEEWTTGLVPLNLVDMPTVDTAARVRQLDNVALVNRRVNLEESLLRLYMCLYLSAPLVRLTLVVDHDNTLNAKRAHLAKECHAPTSYPAPF